MQWKEFLLRNRAKHRGRAAELVVTMMHTLHWELALLITYILVRTFSLPFPFCECISFL